MEAMGKQSGFSLLSAMLLVGGISTAAVLGTIAYKSSEKEAEVPMLIAEDVFHIQEAVYSYMVDNDIDDYSVINDPDFFSDLRANGYFSDDYESPVGTSYTFRVVDDNFEIVVNTQNEEWAQEAKGLVIGGSVNNTTLVSSMPKPSQGEGYEPFVGRFADPSKPYRQEFETDLDMGGNNIDDVQSVNAEEIESTDVVTEQMTSNDVTVDSRLELGEHAVITGSSGQLNIDAATTDIRSNIGVQGDLIGNESNASGINTIETTQLQTTDLETTTLETQEVAAQDADIAVGQIDDITGQSATADDATFNIATSDNVEATNGQITDISGSSASFTNGEVTDLTSQSATIDTASIQAVQGDSVTSNSGVLGSAVIAGDLTSNEVAVDGTASANDLNVSGEASASQELRSNQSANITTTEVSGNGSVNSASGNKVSAASMIAMNTKTVNLNVDGVSHLGTATASGLQVTNTLKTKNVNANQVDVSGNVDFNNAQGNEVLLGGGTLTASVGDFRPGTVTATTGSTSDDAYSSDSSINRNFQLVTTLKDDLDECMNDTKWCFPQQPRIDIWQCGGFQQTSCTQKLEQSTMTAHITARIVDCRHGCTYSWSIPNGFASAGGCASGSVAVGGSKSMTCKIKNSPALAKQAGVTGTAKLTVSSKYPDGPTVSRTKALDLFNDTPNDPFANHSFSFSYPSGTDRTFSGTLGGTLTANAYFSPSDGFSTSDYTITRTSYDVTSGSFCNASFSGSRMTLTHEGGNYDDCRGRVRITATYNGSGEFAGASDNDLSSRLTIGSEGPSDPFDGVRLTPYCSDNSPVNVSETSHACLFSELGEATVGFDRYPLPLSEYSWTINTYVSGPSYECRVLTRGSTTKPGIRVESDRPIHNRCGGRGVITWRHDPTGKTKTYTVEILP